MKFFAQSMNDADWKTQAGCCGIILLELAIVAGFFGGLIYFGYWLGTR